ARVDVEVALGLAQAGLDGEALHVEADVHPVGQDVNPADGAAPVEEGAEGGRGPGVEAVVEAAENLQGLVVDEDRGRVDVQGGGGGGAGGWVAGGPGGAGGAWAAGGWLGG